VGNDIEKPVRFEVALSFPGEHRVRVERVAQALADSLGQEKVLYDKWYRAEFARPGLDVYLPRLYLEQSRLLVFFLSQDYVNKEWCGLEWRIGRDLLKQGADDRLMFLRLDHADIPGLYSIDGYLDVRNLCEAEVAKEIIKRLTFIGAAILPVQNRRLRRSNGVSSVWAQLRSRRVFGAGLAVGVLALLGYLVSSDLRQHSHRRSEEAEINLRQGDYDAALSKYTELIRQKPTSSSYNGRGIAYKDRGDIDAALSDFNEAIRLDRSFSDAYNNRALIFREKGNFSAAAADLTEAVRLAPNDAGPYYNRGLLYKVLGRNGDAASDFQRVLNLSSTAALKDAARAALQALGDSNSPRRQYMTLRLVPGVSRSADPAPSTLRLSSSSDIVRLQVELWTRTPMASGYAVSIRTPEGREVWSHKIDTVSSLASGKLLNVDVPAALLVSGDYLLTVVGGGPPDQVIDDYVFRIYRRSSIAP